jgi:hypothetical protein
MIILTEGQIEDQEIEENNCNFIKLKKKGGFPPFLMPNNIY